MNKINKRKIIVWLSIFSIVVSFAFPALAEGEQVGNTNIDTQSTQAQNGITEPGGASQQATAQPEQSENPSDTLPTEQPQPTTTSGNGFEPLSKAQYSVVTDISMAPLPDYGNTQTVIVTVNVKALDANTPIRNITLYIGNQQQPVTDVFTQPVTADNFQGINMIFPVSLDASQFDTDIEIQAVYTYDVSDGTVSTPTVTARHSAGFFKVQSARDGYTVTVTPDKTIVAEGGTIIYKVEFTNNGNVIPEGSLITFKGQYNNGAEHNIDPIDISGIAFNETKVFYVECKSIVDSITLIPTVTVLHQSKQLDPIYTEIKNASIQIILETIGSTGVPLNGKATIKYTLINNGNVTIKNIKVYDDNYKDRPFPVQELEPGQRMDASTRIQITQNTEVRYRLIAEDIDGQQIRVSSNSVKITLVTSIDDIVLNIKAAVKGSDIITAAQTVYFDVTVTNNSGVTVGNMTVYDMNNNQVVTINSLAPNESKTYTVPMDIKSSENVFFKVEATDQNNNKIDFESNLVPITLNGTTPKPTDTPTPTPEITQQATTLAPTDMPTKEAQDEQDDKQLLIIMLSVVGGLVLIGVIALIIMSSMQKRKARKRRKITRRVR